MINKLIVDGQNVTLNESTKFPFTYTFSKAGVHNVRVGLDQTDEVCAYAFQDCSDLTKVVFPSKIKNIKRYAFENCTSLKSVDLPNTIEYVGPGVFDGCISLEEINFEHDTAPLFYAELTDGTNCFVPDGKKYVLASELIKDGSVQYYEKNSLGGYDEVDYEGLVDGEEYYYDAWTKVHNHENIIENRFKIRPQQIDFIDGDEVATEYPNVEQNTTSQLFDVRLSPENTTNHNIIYLSSNESLVTVSQTGEITTKKYGQGRATIYAITEPYYDGTYVAASLRIRVVDNSNAKTMTLSFTSSLLELNNANIGDVITLPEIILSGDDELQNPEIRYTSSNENVVKFEEGEFKVVGEGNADIIATYDGDDDHKPATATYKVTIALHIDKKEMTLSFSNSIVNKTYKVGDELELQTPILSGDDEIGDPELEWEFEDDDVLIVDDNDKILVNKAGQVIVKVTYNGDDTHTSCEASYTINITIEEEEQNLEAEYESDENGDIQLINQEDNLEAEYETDENGDSQLYNE